MYIDREGIVDWFENVNVLVPTRRHSFSKMNALQSYAYVFIGFKFRILHSFLLIRST